MRYSTSRLRWSAAALGLALSACGGPVEGGPVEPEPPIPVAIAAVSGNNQKGKAGEPLSEPFVVRVTDAQGRGVEGVVVGWNVASGAGVLHSHGVDRGERLSRLTDSDGIIFYCGGEASIFMAPDGSTDGVTVPVGTTVEWTNAEWVSPQCPTRIVSTSVPPGGEPFNSGLISLGDRFQFVPNVAGTWEYVDEVNNNTPIFGGRTGTLTAE